MKESGHRVTLDQQCPGTLELSVQHLRETREVELKERERGERGILKISSVLTASSLNFSSENGK